MLPINSGSPFHSSEFYMIQKLCEIQAMLQPPVLLMATRISWPFEHVKYFIQPGADLGLG